MSRAYIFCGPSLESGDVQRAKAMAGDNLVFLPPARQGDVLRLLRAKPEVIGLIDGFFLQQPAVHFKEILLAIEAGVAVMGAASMGALRAAELACYGMQGIGKIYALYADSSLDGDDEVALVHASEEENYRPLSDALVNMRVNVQRALKARLIYRSTAEAIIKAAKRLHFSERSYDQVLHSLAESGGPVGQRAQLDAFRAYVQRNGVDQKRLDAVALVDAVIARLRVPRGPVVRPAWQTPRTLFLRHFERSYVGHLHGQQFVADHKVFALAKLLLPNFAVSWRQSALLCVSIDQAREQGLVPPPQRVLQAEFQRELGSPSKAVFVGWLARHFMDETELNLWLQERWLAASIAEDVAESAASRLGVSTQRLLIRPTVPPGELWDGPILRHAKATGQFAQWAVLACKVLAYNADMERQTPGLLSRLGTDALEQWFASRWNVSAVGLGEAIAQRGLGGFAEFHDTARLAFMFDALDGEPIATSTPV